MHPSKLLPVVALVGPSLVGSVALAGPIAAGGRHTCAVDATDSVFCWGDNTSGQLGDGTVGAARPLPAPIARPDTLLGVVELRAGRAHTCARTLVGAVFCWGDNRAGQLGNGTLVPSPRPVQVLGLPPVVQLAAGGDHTCAVGNDAAVLCWGSNDFGESLGTAGLPSVAPARLHRPGEAGGSALHVAAGASHTCFADARPVSRGAAFCWGRLSEWQTGYQSPGDAGPFWSTPSVLRHVSAGKAHSCALEERGDVRCTGQLGEVRPDVIASGAPSGFWSVNAIQVVSGGGFACALRKDGTIACWGEDGAGQLGNGPGRWSGWRTGAQVAVTVQGIFGAVDVTAGEEHACAVTSRGELHCWGRGTEGQLGDGKTRSAEAPVKAKLERPARFCLDAGCPLRCPEGTTGRFGVCEAAK